jgi:RNA polymerase sigma factor (TIGR02999 family)
MMVLIINGTAGILPTLRAMGELATCEGHWQTRRCKRWKSCDSDLARARFRGIADGEAMKTPPPKGGFFPLVYDELRRLAAAQLAGEAAGHTLDATGLVHEAYLRLGGGSAFEDRRDFLRAASVSMQRILVDHARRKRAAKRGGRARKFPVLATDRVVVDEPDTLLDIDDALTRLAAEDATSADVARFRLFAGISIDEAALALGISRATAFREWAYARSWLTTALAARDRNDRKDDDDNTDAET